MEQCQAAAARVSGMLPIAAVGPLLQVAVMIYAQVNTAKKNVSHCRRLAEEVKAMEPILKNIEARVDTMPPATKDMIDKALDLLLKDFQNALDFIVKQKKTGAVKRFVVAKTTDEVFQDIRNHIRDSREIFILAMVNKIDETVSSASVSVTTATPRGATTTTISTESVLLEARSPDVGAAKSPDVDSANALAKLRLARQNTSPAAGYDEISSRKLASMREAFAAKKYDESIKIGKDILKTAPKGEEITIVTYLSIACAYACLGQPEDAMTYLETAKENHWDDPSFLESPDLENLRNYPEFVLFKEKMTQEMLQNERWRQMPEVEVDYFTNNFQRYDVDGSGTICKTEFKVLMKRTASIAFTDDQIMQKFDEIDVDKSGNLALNEFLNFVADHKDYFKVPVAELNNAMQDFNISGSHSAGGYSPTVSARPADRPRTPPSLPTAHSNPAFSISAAPIAQARPTSPPVAYAAAPSAKPLPPVPQQAQQQQQSPPQQSPASPYSSAPPTYSHSQSAPDFSSSYGLPPSTQQNTYPPPTQHNAYPPAPQYGAQPPPSPSPSPYSQAPPPTSQPPYSPQPSHYQPYGQPPPSYMQQPPSYPPSGYQDGASTYPPQPAYGAPGGYGQQQPFSVYGSGEFSQGGYPLQPPQDAYPPFGAATGYPPHGQYYPPQDGSFNPYRSY